ncbi:MAG: DUF1499 domain-containing protein [Pseudomonadota bacterium]
MKIGLVILAGFAGLIAASLIWVRVAPTKPENWHKDPDEVSKIIGPRVYLLSTSSVAHGEPFDTSLGPNEALKYFENVTASEDRVVIVAGSSEEGMVTLMQRSARVGFPDFVTVKAVATSEGSRISIYSRSRFGHRDFGVNKARVTQWLRALQKK